MKSHVKLSIGLFCALGMSFAACGKKEDKAESKPETAETKPAPETAKPETAPVEAAKPVEPAPVAVTAPKAVTKLELSDKDMGKAFEKSLESGKITVFEKEFASKDVCNETTILNPDTVEVFETTTPDQLVVLCPGGLDGETNVVTLFEKGKEPRSESVSPPDSTHHIEDEQLTSAVQKLLAAE
jgi:hypothetical protein